MSINITQKPEVNVVNVGEELTQDQINAITGANVPDSSNVFATLADVGSGLDIVSDRVSNPPEGQVITNPQVSLQSGLIYTAGTTAYGGASDYARHTVFLEGNQGRLYVTNANYNSNKTELPNFDVNSGPVSGGYVSIGIDMGLDTGPCILEASSGFALTSSSITSSGYGFDINSQQAVLTVNQGSGNVVSQTYTCLDNYNQQTLAIFGPDFSYWNGVTFPWGVQIANIFSNQPNTPEAYHISQISSNNSQHWGVIKSNLTEQSGPYASASFEPFLVIDPLDGSPYTDGSTNCVRFMGVNPAGSTSFDNYITDFSITSAPQNNADTGIRVRINGVNYILHAQIEANV